MVIREQKNVPLHMKFGLFTEAPKRRKKRVISVRTSRARDYTAGVDPEEVELNNISPEEDSLSGEVDNISYDNPEGGMGDGTVPDTGQPYDTSDTTGGDTSSTDGTQITDTQDSTGGDSSGTEPETNVSTVSGTDGGTSPGDVSGEYDNNDISSTEGDGTSGEQPDGTPNGDTPVQTPTEPAGAVGDDGNVGTINTTAENPANTDGAGDVTPTDDVPAEPAEDEVVEIDEPTDDDDFTVNIDSGDDNAETMQQPSVPQNDVDPTMDTTADPTVTDPNAAPDPDAGVNADLEAFDKNDMRKYQLFKRFIDLHDVVMHFVSTLEAIISDDASYGEVISKVTKRLKKSEGILKDYMILKFQSDSYLQNSFFFAKSKTAILLALEMLKEGKKQNADNKQ